MRILFALLCVFVGQGALHAEDWPQFRGPTGHGHSSAEALPLNWSNTDGVVWKTAIPGVGWSSPVVAGNTVYLTTAVAQGEDTPDADRSLRAIALDTETGAIRWSTEVFIQKAAAAARIHRKNSHASPTPVIENDLLFVHYGHQGTACLDAASGAVRWKNRKNSYKPVHGNGSSPILIEDLLVFSADGGAEPAIIALDKATGKTRWKVARTSEAKRKFSFATPLAIEVDGSTQIVTPGSGVVNGLEPSSGREIWRFTYDQGYSVVPRPVLAKGLLFVGTGYDRPRCLAIRTGGSGDITETHLAWEQTKYAPHNPSMIVVGDEFYMVADNGMLSCLDVESGQVHYQERCTGPISASILFGDDKLYLLDERGMCTVVKPGKRFEILAKNDLDERALASPSVIQSDLLLRTEEHLYRISASE